MKRDHKRVYEHISTLSCVHTRVFTRAHTLARSVTAAFARSVANSVNCEINSISQSQATIEGERKKNSIKHEKGKSAILFMALFSMILLFSH